MSIEEQLDELVSMIENTNNQDIQLFNKFVEKLELLSDEFSRMIENNYLDKKDEDLIYFIDKLDTILYNATHIYSAVGAERDSLYNLILNKNKMKDEIEVRKNKKIDYTDKNIEVDFSNITKLSINDSPMGKERKDRSVHVTDNTGKSMRSSNIMLGKQNVEFLNGEYLNIDEVVVALEKYLNEVTNDNTEIICKKTGKKVEKQDVINDIINIVNERIGKIKLDGKVEKINNQNSSRLILQGINEEKYMHKGALMLGNKGINLPNGEYINVDDIKIALEKYLLREKKEIIIPPPPINADNPVLPNNDEEKEQNKTFTVKKTKKKYPIPAALLPVVAAIMLAITPTNVEALEIIDGNTQAMVEVQKGVDKHIFETDEETIMRVLGNFNTGDKISIEEGVNFYESSDHAYGGANKNGTFGEGLRESGDYTLDYVSIVDKSTGNIISKLFNQNMNIKEFINQTLNDNKLDFDHVDILFHIGGPVSGWINLNELNNIIENKKIIGTEFNVENSYNGEENDFKGIISIQTENGIVDLNLLNKDGQLVSNGDIVIGSDNKEYRITNLNIIENDEQKKVVTSTVYGLDKEKAFAGALVGLLATAGISVAYAEITKKVKKETINEDEFTEKFKETKDKYKKQSLWNKLVSKIFKRKDKNINISREGIFIKEEIEELYEETNNSKRGKR